MISDIKLNNIMINYHPTIIWWLAKNKIIEHSKKGWKLFDWGRYKESKDYPKTTGSRIIETYSDGVKHIYGDYGYSKDWAFCQIHLKPGVSFKEITDDGIDVYDIKAWSDRYCLTSKFEKLIERHSDIILDFLLTDSYPRLKGDSVKFYMKVVENQIEFIKSNNYHLKGYYSFNFSYYGRGDGFNDYYDEVEKAIKRYGIFSHLPIYKRIEWDFDMVEKYKDSIIWPELMANSNLEWTEEMINKYESYIHFCNEQAVTYCEKFFNVFDNYKSLGFLSNDFLEKHKDKLNWEEVIKYCKFKWNAEELTYFCNYFININMPYSTEYFLKDVTVASQLRFSLRFFLLNTNFNWDVDNLFALIKINGDIIDSIVENKHLYDIFLSIPNIKEYSIPYIKNEYFWDTIEYNHPFDYDPLSKEFTLENIKRNIKNWSNQENVKFVCSRRTPDTNYYIYKVMTHWDKLIENKNVPLTYEIAKYLSTIKIVVGGEYEETDSGFMEEDNRWPNYNGLSLFAEHHIENDNEINKIIDDEDVLSILLDYKGNINEDILMYICHSFFEKCSYSDYINVINKMKDWDTIKDLSIFDRD